MNNYNIIELHHTLTTLPWMIFPFVPVAYMYIEKGKSEDNEIMAKLHVKNSKRPPIIWRSHILERKLRKRGYKRFLMFLMLETNEREKTVTCYDRSHSDRD